MLEVDKLKGVRVVGCTHDEIISICPKEIAEERFANMIEIMSTPPTWAPDVPLAAEGGWARNYSK
jgi:DNA polymerase